MAKQIFINDSIGTVEFPDTMSEQEIVKAIRFDILKESPETGETPKSESPVTVSTPIVNDGKSENRKQLEKVINEKLNPSPDINKLSFDANKITAQEELKRLQADKGYSIAIGKVNQAVSDFNTNPTEENRKKAIDAYESNKDIVDYYQSTAKIAGAELNQIQQLTQAPEENKSSARKQVEKVFNESQAIKETADAQITLQEALATGKSVKKIQEERGGRIARGTKNFLSGAVGTLQGDVAFLGEVTGLKGLKDASNLLKQQVERMSPEEMDIIDQIINAGGSSAAFIVPGLGTEALALRMPRMMSIANTLRIGVPTILEAAAEAGNTADQSRQEGKSDAEVKKAM